MKSRFLFLLITFSSFTNTMETKQDFPNKDYWLNLAQLNLNALQGEIVRIGVFTFQYTRSNSNQGFTLFISMSPKISGRDLEIENIKVSINKNGFNIPTKDPGFSQDEILEIKTYAFNLQRIFLKYNIQSIRKKGNAFDIVLSGSTYPSRALIGEPSFLANEKSKFTKFELNGFKFYFPIQTSTNN